MSDAKKDKEKEDSPLTKAEKELEELRKQVSTHVEL